MNQRRTTLFFAGNVPDAHLVDTQPDTQLAAEAYSEGVRQLVWKYHRNRTGFRIVSRSQSYVADWSESQFCLAPQGVGWGVRLSWAIGAGCIPLLASSEVTPWFDDAIDYNRFALTAVPKLDGLRHELPFLLGKLSASRRAEMQRSVWRHRDLFLWGGHAFHMTMHELCLRAARLRKGPRAKVACAQLLPHAAEDILIPPGRRGATASSSGPRRRLVSSANKMSYGACMCMPFGYS